MRKAFELTEAQDRVLNDAAEHLFTIMPRIVKRDGTVPAIDNAVAKAWDQLGRELGFDADTVEFDLKRDRFFTAMVK